MDTETTTVDLVIRLQASGSQAEAAVTWIRSTPSAT